MTDRVWWRKGAKADSPTGSSWKVGVKPIITLMIHTHYMYDLAMAMSDDRSKKQSRVMLDNKRLLPGA